MGHNHLSLLISFICVLLLWPQVQMGSISSKVSAGDATSAGEGEEGPLALKRSVEACDTSFDNYCLHGECMLLVDENKNHCKCELGFHGTRCEHPQLVYKPLSDGELALYIVCAILLIIGLAGALYFFCKWYKKKSLPQQPKQQGYRGVQTA